MARYVVQGPAHKSFEVVADNGNQARERAVAQLRLWGAKEALVQQFSRSMSVREKR
jgi:hypothetical protein